MALEPAAKAFLNSPGRGYSSRRSTLVVFARNPIRLRSCALLATASLFSFMATAVRLKESVFMFLTRREREKNGPP